MIRLEDLTYRYRDDYEPAVRNLNLEIPAGESVCIMGSNGSGKSTLARLIAGLVKPERGRVIIDAAPESPLQVGILFQNPDNQMVAVTVEKEIAFALENLGVPPDQMKTRVEQTLQRFGISHLRQRLTSELSGGEKQRVALAAVMIFRPPVLVLDEPDSYLDQAGKSALQDELGKVRRESSGAILVRITQYPNVARDYSRLIVLHRGEVAADGAPDEILGDTTFCLQTGLAIDPGQEFDDTLLVPPTDNGSAGISAVALKDVGFAYPGQAPIVTGLSLSLSAGQTLAVVGPSGSGKSTLGLLLSGLLKPSAGTITFTGATGEPVPESSCRGRVSGIFQLPERQFFLPTCREEVEFGPANLNRPLADEEVDGFLQLTGLDARRFEARDPFTLSGGEKRRLAFAAVLSMSPDVIVFDEPTCGLDLEGAGRFIRLADTLTRQGKTLVVVTHDGDVVDAVADEVLVLGTAQSPRCVGVDDFFSDPRHATVVSPRRDRRVK